MRSQLVHETGVSPTASRCAHRRGRGHGVLEDLLPFRERQIAREDDAASFVTLGQQSEQDLHLFAILLHVTDVVDDEGTELRETSQQARETQLAFRQQQFLHQKRARREQNAMPPMATSSNAAVEKETPYEV